MISLEQLYQEALTQLEGVAEGEGLSELDAAFIRFAVCVSPSCLNTQAIDQSVAAVLAAGGTREQIGEAMALVSGLGVHTLMVASSRVLQAVEHHGEAAQSKPLDSAQQQLWQQYVGDDDYWQQFERFVPGFLGSLLRLSVGSFKGFFQYCAIPWKTRHLPASLKELIALTSDATPSHRYQPGLRLHIHNAIQLGVGRRGILQALALGAAAPEHQGVAG